MFGCRLLENTRLNAPFDTLQLADRLASGGFTEEQAKTAAAAISDAFKTSLATQADIAEIRQEMQSLATKADISELRQELALFRQELKAENAALRQELKTENATLRQELKTENATLRQELKTEHATLRQELKADNATLRHEFKTNIAEVKVEMFRLVVGAIGFQTILIIGTVIALLKLFLK